MPLQGLVTAVMERVVGYRLLSEGLVVASAYAIASVLTFLAARAASASTSIGVLAAAFQLAVGPRTYAYPKIVVYAAGILALWYYIDRPSVRRAGLLGATVALGFHLRHDHGLYLGLVTTGVLALRHSRDWKTGLRHIGLFAAAGLALVAPWLVYVQREAGLAAYTHSLRSIAVREYQQNRFDSWPAWPFTTMADVVDRRVGPPSAAISVGWDPKATDDARREVAARYGIQVDDDEPVESGRFLLTDVSRDNVLALIADPAIEDTGGIDRATGDVHLQGLWLGTFHLFGGLDEPFAAAGFLFYLFMALLVATVLALARVNRTSGLALDHERVKIAAVVLVGIVTSIGFIREPLAVRVPDAVVAPAVLASWWAGKWLLGVRASRALGRAVLVAGAAVLLLVSTRAAVVVGAVSARLERVERLPAIWERLVESPPDSGQALSSPKRDAVRFVRSCTSPDEPLLVLWFAPDLKYHSDRPFAGRLSFYMEGYWTSAAAERRNIAAIERDRPPFALMETDRDVTDLYTYPRLLQYLAQSYHPVGTLPAGAGRSIEIFARNDRSPLSTYSVTDWPCFREMSKGPRSAFHRDPGGSG